MQLSLAFVVAVATALLGTGNAFATPLEERAVVCKKPDYGPFRLYAAPVDPNVDWMPLRLLDLYTPRPTNDTISALFYSSDPDLGRVPAYWVLKNKVLSAVFTDAQFETINKAVVADSEVRFVTSDAASLRKQIAREWCAVRNPTNPTTGLPGYLSVKGSAEQFTYCTSFPVVGNPTQASIYYKAVVPSTGGDLERYCFKAHLVIQSIGIIAEPIPA